VLRIRVRIPVSFRPLDQGSRIRDPGYPIRIPKLWRCHICMITGFTEIRRIPYIPNKSGGLNPKEFRGLIRHKTAPPPRQQKTIKTGSRFKSAFPAWIKKMAGELRVAERSFYQCFESGYGSGLDADSVRSVNLDPDPGGQKITLKKIEKKVKKFHALKCLMFSFEVGRLLL
jgi:hypothetical protein